MTTQAMKKADPKTDYVFADELVDENGKPLVSEDSEDITEG